MSRLETIEGTNHATLAVRDLERSYAFYNEVLGPRAVARWDEGAYLAACGDRKAPILDQNVRDGPLLEYTHLALHLRRFLRRDRRAGGRVELWQKTRTPGESVLLDPDGHKLEIRTSGLCCRIAADKCDPPQGMIFFD